MSLAAVERFRRVTLRRVEIPLTLQESLQPREHAPPHLEHHLVIRRSRLAKLRTPVIDLDPNAVAEDGVNVREQRLCGTIPCRRRLRSITPSIRFTARHSRSCLPLVAVVVLPFSEPTVLRFTYPGG